MDPVSSGHIIRAVIFDMDGVLTDSEPLINAAAIAMFHEKDLVVQPQDFLPFVGAGEDRYIGGVAEKYRFPLDLPAAKKRTYEIYLSLVPSRLNSFPGAVELVQAARRAGLRVAVGSSADRVKILANLEKIGLPINSWDAVITGEEVHAKKPAPDLFLAAAAKLALPPAECTVIEDAVNGVQAAKAAGMRCVAVAQTFPAQRLGEADLVRLTISEVTLDDLCPGFSLGPPQQPLSPNQKAQSSPGSDSSWHLPTGLPPKPPSAPASELALQESPADGAASRSSVVLDTSPEGGVRATTSVASARLAWGLWPTLGLGAAIAVAFVGTQEAVAVIWAVGSTLLHHGHLPKSWESQGLFLATVTCAGAPVAFGFSWLFAHLRQSVPAAEYLGFRRVPLRALVPWTIALVGLIAASDLLTLHLARPIVPEFMQQAYRTAGFAPLLWLALLLAAPLAEETLFRGFLFRGLLYSRLGELGAVTITALTWASIHLQYDAYGMGTVFVIGLFLGLVRLRTGSLLPSVFLHFLMNLIATIETVVWLRTSGA